MRLIDKIKIRKERLVIVAVNKQGIKVKVYDNAVAKPKYKWDMKWAIIF